MVGRTDGQTDRLRLDIVVVARERERDRESARDGVWRTDCCFLRDRERSRGVSVPYLLSCFSRHESNENRLRGNGDCTVIR